MIRRITQHKRFAYARPNFCFAKTSFMLGTLYAMPKNLLEVKRMRIYSISIRNYRPFKVLGETRLGPLATIVGKNDAGKSSILRAIQLFF